jgi:hypothetical protein
MRKIIISLVFVLCSVMSIAQQSTYRAVEYTFGEWNTYYQKYNWSEKEYVDIPIVVTPKTITIYSQVVQHYKVLSDAVRIDSEITEYYAVDQDGDHCHIWIMVRGTYVSVSVKFSNICFFYRIESY